MKPGDTKLISSSYRDSMVVKATPEQVFDALTSGIAQWWTEYFTGSAVKQNDQFTVCFGKTFKTFVVEEFVANKKIAWKCIDALIDSSRITNKTEWKGTSVIWQITPGNEEATITITHLGLIPEFECYDFCEKGWQYFTSSLCSFLTTGQGSPYKKSN